MYATSNLLAYMLQLFFLYIYLYKLFFLLPETRFFCRSGWHLTHNLPASATGVLDTIVNYLCKLVMVSLSIYVFISYQVLV